MVELYLDNITVGTRLSRASLRVKSGELSVILGPNGAGKSTLLKTAMGLIRPDSGSVIYNHQNHGQTQSAQISAMDRARLVSYLPQIRPMAWPNIVYDIVALGRYAHGANLTHLMGEDKIAVEAAIQDCGLNALATRPVDTLSGGELARMHCARAFAAKAPLLLADEPVAALDPQHRFRIMDLIKDYVNKGGGALIVLHDLNLAARYADRLVWMKAGNILAQGSVPDTLTAQRIDEIYGVKAHIKGQNVQLIGL